MDSNAVWFAHAVLALAATYLMHSTILLGSVWLLVKLLRTSSHTLEDKLWKLAAVLGLLTAPLQLSLGWPSLLDVTFSPSGGKAIELDRAPSTRLPDVSHDALAPRATAEHNVDTSPGRLVIIPEGNVAGGEISDGLDRRLEWPSDALPLRTTNSDAEVPPTPLSINAEDPRRLLPSSPSGVPFDLVSVAVFLAAMVLTTFTAGGFVLFVIQSLALRRRFADARLLDAGPARRSLDRLLKRHARGCRVRLLSADTCNEPVVFGLTRWTIVLPANAEERLERDELQALLAHELAHLVRGDLWWLWIGRLLCTCLVIQPLNFQARRRWRQATEYLCDEWAVQRGVQGLSLARCLTQIAQWRLGGEECSAVLAAGGSNSTLIRRVERLVDRRSTIDAWASQHRRRWFALSASLVAVAFFAIAPRVGFPSPSGTAPAINAKRTNLTAEAHSGSSTDQSDWLLLEEELQRLDVDLVRANTLLDRAPPDHQISHIAESLHRHAEQIRQRRRRIAGFMEKE